MLQLTGVDIDIILLEKSKCFVNEQGSLSLSGKTPAATWAVPVKSENIGRSTLRSQIKRRAEDGLLQLF